MAVSLDLALLEVWKNGGQAIVAAVLTAVILKAQSVRAEVLTHDRLAGYVNEDLGRWVRDRDQVADSRLNEIRQDASAKGVARGGALAQARGKVYAHALREYRDEAVRNLRAVKTSSPIRRDGYTFDGVGTVGTHCAVRGCPRMPARSSLGGGNTRTRTCRARRWSRPSCIWELATRDAPVSGPPPPAHPATPERRFV